MFWIHMLLLLVIIFIGIRYGGIAFGLLGGLGVSILVFFFGIVPGTPPVSVMLIILAVVAASATLEATGGLNLLVAYAERLLRNHPQYVVYLGPLCTYSLTVLVGTGHSVYPLLPVIYDVAYNQGIRPERPLAVSTVASQMGITASPIAAAAAVVRDGVVEHRSGDQTQVDHVHAARVGADSLHAYEGVPGVRAHRNSMRYEPRARNRCSLGSVVEIEHSHRVIALVGHHQCGAVFLAFGNGFRHT